MFDDITRELKRLSRGVEISVSIPSDADGFDDKECPNPKCLARFRIHTDDWSNLVADDAVYCPICRHEADSQQWFTQEQIEYAQQVAFQQVQGHIDRAFQGGVRRANRQAPRGGLISFSFEYKPGRRTYVAPLSAGGILEQRSSCENCGCRYASIGAAFFCPACGHNSARSTFADSLVTVRASLDLLPQLPKLVGKDAAADLARGIAENALVKLVTAFQRVAEATYDAIPDPKTRPSFNAFQRLPDGSELFRRATGRGYDDALDQSKLAELGRYFQQRHLLVHEDGIVDQQYVDRSGDATYRPGQRLVIKPAAVRHAADLIEELARAIAP